MDENTRLQYLQAMGVDVWLPRTKPCDEEHIAEKNVVTQIPEVAKKALINEQNSVSNDAAWESLEASVVGCQSCQLCVTRTQTVFGSGDKQADWMLIGEAPGYHEDIKGEPFVGKAGQLLTEMLRALQLTREQVYIANIVKCRPPDNRDPAADEIENCAHHLQQQIRLVQPKIILAVGRVAAQSLLNNQQALGKLRGRVHTFQNTPLVVVYHPAYLLRNLSDKSKAWADLLMAAQVFASTDQSI